MNLRSRARSSALGLAAVTLVAVTLDGCNCGPGVGAPCKTVADCGPGLTCTLGACAAPRDGGGGGTGGAGGAGGAGGTGGTGGAGGGSACVGLQCQQVSCTNGQRTTLTGKVYAPNGTLPLYNAVVYVPNAAVSAFTPGVSCDKCGGGLSGSPVVKTVTDATGTFVLQDVPSGANIPLVIQVGRWRRQVTIATVPECTTTTLTNPDLTRLPRNKSEGDIPLMAIATGSIDPFECLLRKIGIDDAEFTAPSGTGRVHYYVQNGKDLNPPAPRGTALFDTLATLNQHDVVILPCEAAEHPKTAAETQNIIDYANGGGRVFTTHFSYVWIKLAQPPFPGTGVWADAPNPPNPNTFDLDVSFPKGASFADWLVNVGASTTRGRLSIAESRVNLTSVTPALAQRWIYGPNMVQHYTFNTPVAALLPDGGAPDQCGRVLFSDFHVSTAALSGQPTFPASCVSVGGLPAPMTGQEKALAFMLFDLSSCVQRDEVPVITKPQP